MLHKYLVSTFSVILVEEASQKFPSTRRNILLRLSSAPFSSAFSSKFQILEGGTKYSRKWYLGVFSSCVRSFSSLVTAVTTPMHVSPILRDP